MNNEHEVSAGEVIARELAGLTAAGASFVPASAPDPQADETSPTIELVRKFIGICTAEGVTVKELAGGTGLMISEVKAALSSLQAEGTVKCSAEEEVNYRRYSLTNPVPKPVLAPAAPYISDAQRWDMAARKRVSDEAAAKRAPEPRRPVITDEMLDAEMEKRTHIKLTADELKELRLTDGYRRNVNPNAFIKR
jgi:hypothetical protein